MTDTQELLEQSFEINLNNYGPEDVERLNDWAIKAYAALGALQAENDVQTKAANHWMTEANTAHNLSVKQGAEIEALLAEVKHLNLHLKATQSGRDADEADSMSPIAREAGDKRAVLVEALAALDTAQPEPVNAMLVEALEGVKSRCKSGYVGTDGQYLKVVEAALTAAKQAQPERAPLSDDEIQTIYLRTYNEGFHGRNLEIAFARAIEAAIKQGGQYE